MLSLYAVMYVDSTGTVSVHYSAAFLMTLVTLVDVGRR